MLLPTLSKGNMILLEEIDVICQIEGIDVNAIENMMGMNAVYCAINRGNFA